MGFLKNFGGFYKREYSTSSNDPIASDNGLGAKSYYTYRSGVSYDTDISVGCTGALKLSWSDATGSRTVTFKSIAASTMTIVPN